MADTDNVLTKIHDLLLYLVPQLAKFPRDQKFLLADRIESKVLDVQERCLRAYYSRDKRIHLIEANMGLEIIRHLVRLSYDLRLISPKSYEQISIRVEGIGRMVGGWMKKSSSRPETELAP